MVRQGGWINKFEFQQVPSTKYLVQSTKHERLRTYQEDSEEGLNLEYEYLMKAVDEWLISEVNGSERMPTIGKG